MQFEAVNVQQFLTDVSATGEEDGFKDAEEAAKRFRQGVTKFEAMARQKNDSGMLAEIQVIAKDFDAMYDTGVRMLVPRAATIRVRSWRNRSSSLG